MFHLAAQVAVTTSLDDPRDGFRHQPRAAPSTLLEALRRRGDRVPLIFASTNKVYGDLAGRASWSERRTPMSPIDPHPRARHRRGPAAGFPHALWLLQGRGGPVCPRLCPQLRPAGRRAAHELHLRPAPVGTEDQGWVAHFLIRALAGEPITHLRRRLAGARRAACRRLRWRPICAVLAQHRRDRAGRRSTSAADPPTPSACAQVIDCIERARRPCRRDASRAMARPATSAITSPTRGSWPWRLGWRAADRAGARACATSPTG